MVTKTKDTASRVHDDIFDGCSAVEDIASEILQIARALQELGVPAGERLASLIYDQKKQAQTIRHAFAEYVGALANGTLYAA